MAIKLKFKASGEGDLLTIDWPVKVSFPEPARPGHTKNGRHTEKTAYVTYQMLPDSDLTDLLEELRKHNRRINAAKAKVDAAKDDDEREEAEEEAKAAEDGYKSWRVELLTRVVVGFPKNHNWDAFFDDLPDFSAELVEAMADYRMIGKAMEDAYWAMVNGGK